MKFSTILLLSSLFISILYGQQPDVYLVTFDRKDSIKPAPETFLSARAIDRRIKQGNGRLILAESDYPVSASLVEQVRHTGAEIRFVLKWFNAVSVKADRVQLAAISRIMQVNRIEKLAPLQSKITAASCVQTGVPDFTRLAKATALRSDLQLQLSEIDKVHAVGITGDSVVVGVLDSGFELLHETLQNCKVSAKYDFVRKDTITANEPDDAFGQDRHGTYVLSILAGYKPGVFIGAAHGVTLVLAKTEDIATEKHVEEDNFAAALEWMDSIGVDLVTSSLGYSTFDKGQNNYKYWNMDGKTTVVTRAVNAAFEKGIACFNSAGNEGTDSWYYITAPADAYNVIAVGAVDATNFPAAFSGHGPTYDGRMKPELTALGVNVFGAASATLSDFATQNGTSAATPIVAGAGALLLSAYPFLTNTQVRNILLQNGREFPVENNTTGYGLLSAFKAVTQPAILVRPEHVLIYKVPPAKNIANYTLHLSAGDAQYIEYSGTYNNKTYQFAPAYHFSKGRADMFFTYSDSLGRTIREPEIGAFYTNDWSMVYRYLPLQEQGKLTSWYPNPFRYNTYANLPVAEPGAVLVRVYAISGDLVYEKRAFMNKPGVFLVDWNGRDLSNQPVSSGVYVCEVSTSSRVFRSKVIRLK